MKPRIFLLIFLFGSCVLTAQREKAPPQLNYLIILGDEISAAALGSFGSLNPNTSPYIDKLVAEWISFTNMFVSEAICAPTRAELLTGLQPHRNGCYANHMNTNEGTLSIVQHLEKLGYRVGLAGKRHFGPKAVYPFLNVEGFKKSANARVPIAESWDGATEFMIRDTKQSICLFICSIHAPAPWDSGEPNLWSDGVELPPNLVDNDTTRYYFQKHLIDANLFLNVGPKGEGFFP